MRIAYLVNQYPHVSHSFIRREIAALEAGGVEMHRVSIRRTVQMLPDPSDRAEAERTKVLLDAGATGLLLAVLVVLVKRPMRLCKALWLAVRLGRKSDRGLLRHLVYLAESCVLLRVVEAEETQHIHAHFGTNSAAVAMLCRVLGGPSYSFTVHGPEEFDRPVALALGEKIARAAFVVAVSEYGRSQLYRWCSYADWAKIRVIHCGVDDVFLKAAQVPAPEAKRLVCVGRLCEQKGQLLLVQAAAELIKAGLDFELRLVGDGPIRADIETLIRQLGVHDAVHIIGWKSGAEVREEIVAARAMVLPSFAEGLPVVLMEAMGLGRPVISTYIAGISELVESGVSGWLVPAGSVEALADAMREALDAPPERLERMGQAGRQRVLERHNAGVEAARLATLFRRSIVESRAMCDLPIREQGEALEATPAEEGSS